MIGGRGCAVAAMRKGATIALNGFESPSVANPRLLSLPGEPHSGSRNLIDLFWILAHSLWPRAFYICLPHRAIFAIRGCTWS